MYVCVCVPLRVWVVISQRACFCNLCTRAYMFRGIVMDQNGFHSVSILLFILLVTMLWPWRHEEMWALLQWIHSFCLLTSHVVNYSSLKTDIGAKQCNVCVPGSVLHTANVSLRRSSSSLCSLAKSRFIYGRACIVEKLSECYLLCIWMLGLGDKWWLGHFWLPLAQAKYSLCSLYIYSSF